MTDLISRQAVIDLFPNDALEWDTNYGYIAPHYARRMIEELPSAQPEIIRCKDCLHWEPVPNCEIGVCHKAFSPKAAAETDFCSWGVRKGNG